MLIIKSKNLIFIHPRKTAGQSICYSLQPHLSHFDIQIGGTEFGEDVQKYYTKYYKLYKHSKPYDVISFLGQYVDGYKFFCTIRHPVDRTISMYRYLKDKHKKADWSPDILEAVYNMNSINDFIQSEYFQKEIKPCHYYVYNYNIQYIYTFLRYENLQEDFRNFTKKIWGHEIELKHVNKSEFAYKDSINQKSKDILKKYFEKDFEEFGYEY